MSYNKFKKLRKGTYKVLIDSSFRKGSMTYADFLIKGKSKKEILLTTYTCHPSMGNNETSGISLLSYLGEYLNKINKKKIKFFLQNCFSSRKYRCNCIYKQKFGQAEKKRYCWLCCYLCRR